METDPCLQSLTAVFLMSFLEVVKSRHSVRKFKSDPVSDDLIKSILETATASPSWCNSQPWKVIVATGETLNTIRSEFIRLRAAETDLDMDIPSLHRTDLSKESAQCMGQFFSLDDLKNPDFINNQMPFFDAPAVIYFTVPKTHSEYSVLDIGGFYMTVMLAAKAKGLDTIPAAATVNFCGVLHRVLSVPQEESFLIGIALGYAADDKINAFVPPKMKVDDFVTIKH